MDLPLDIDPDVRRASTLPGRFYRSASVYEALRERVFARSWQVVEELAGDDPGPSVRPFELLPGMLDEPLVRTRDEGGVERCLSNVCTHRGNLVCLEPGDPKGLRCGYHGRRFELDGCFQSMPEFEGAEGFPSKADDLPAVALDDSLGLPFVSLDPAVPFAQLSEGVHQLLGEHPFAGLRLDPERSRDYDVRANWALYVDNYLEGFHVPFVHPGLARSIDYASYRTELFSTSNVQIGSARDAQPTFAGTEVAAYYFWLFPNTMLNVYPWGLSLNVVQPVALDRTRVLFRSYVGKPELLDQGAGSDLDQVEMEDEAVVEQVQRGIRSRLYRRGRYSPTYEAGVHQFHRLLVHSLDG